MLRNLLNVAVVIFLALGTWKCSKNTEPFLILEIGQRKTNIFIKNESDPGLLQFRGDSLKYKIGEQKYIMVVDGIGKILYKNVIIDITQQKISINGSDLPSTDINFVLEEDGKFHTGFIPFEN